MRLAGWKKWGIVRTKLTPSDGSAAVGGADNSLLACADVKGAEVLSAKRRVALNNLSPQSERLAAVERSFCALVDGQGCCERRSQGQSKSLD